jgi:formate C-acetyltransferase
MYEFREVSNRILRLRQQVRDRVLRCDAERSNIVTAAWQKYENVIPIIKKPLVLLELCAQMTVLIGDDELIVGNKGPHLFSSPAYPEWGVTDWILEPLSKGEWELKDDGLYHNPPDEEVRQTISPEDFEDLKAVAAYWPGHRIGAVADAWKPDGYEELERLGVSSYVPGGMGLLSLPTGHLVAGYKKIVDTGYQAIRDEAQAWLDAHYGNLMGTDIDRYLFYKSAVIACDAAILLVTRYAEACTEKAAAEPDPGRKAELERMAQSLAWLATNPARTFWEALQATMLYQVFMNIDVNIPSPSLGRIDQYTWPYLKRDLEAGSITLNEAQELLDAFFLKANCFYGAGPGKLVDTTGIGNTYQHTTIGGVAPATGEDATNPVTFMVLETVGRLQLHDPTISLRTNRATPDELWDCAIQTSRLVGGLPLYQNDEVIIPALMKERGFTLEDARDYGIIGCQEIVGCGNDFPAPNGLFPPHASVHWGKIFDMAINNGINPYNGEQASLQTGYLYEMNSIEEVRDALARMGRHVMKLFLSINNYADYVGRSTTTEASLSISMAGCMERGIDAAHGGCVYNGWGGTATGLATLADSLSTIKYLVFDKKLVSAHELLDAVLANWEGHEELRQRVLNEVPHYGNADPYVDEELKWCVELYYQICQECENTRGGRYTAGLYGASDHVRQGHDTWATPDGRRTGEPIADAMSPAQSRDTKGPTAVFHSTCSFDHSHYMGGMAVNLRMHPSALQNAEGAAKLRDLTKTYFEQGGMEVQYNVVDTDTLRKAQEHPADYRDLVVRIAGYSAYFVELGSDLQNDIISRHENEL